ncbi:MAG: putative capsid protein [Cressdnaviricota sp.]|nr:MAG: putative capsid protein [Cressdnaviricota sp.]
MPGYKRKRTPLLKNGRRRRFGARRFMGKASRTIRQRKPARFAPSRSTYRLNTAVARTIRSMAETKIIPFREQEWSQPAATPTGVGIAAVKFVSGATSVTQYPNYLPVSGFNASQGDTKNSRDGQFCYLKGSSVALTIQMDHEPTPGTTSCISFRVICFKQRRYASPAGSTMSPETNLFLTNAGSNFGDGSAAPNNMTPMDILLQPCNTNNYQIISDRKFVLSHTSDESAVQKYNSYKVLRYKLNHNTKARYLTTTNEPVDYNYRFLWAVYAYYPQQAPASGADMPLTWSASIRGTTGFNDL